MTIILGKPVSVKSIQNVNVRYKDPVLISKINRFSGMFGKKLSCLRSDKIDIIRFNKPKVSLKNLQKGNVLYGHGTYSKKGCRLTKINSADSDEIIFSQRSKFITTASISCLSLMLYNKEMNIAAGLHIDSIYRGHDDINNGTSPIYKEMFLLGYLNLKKMVKDSPITAYFSGLGKMLDRPGRPEEDLGIMHNRKIFDLFLSELINRGIGIKVIDIGGKYHNQELFLKTGEYHVIPTDDKEAIYP